MFGFWQGNRLTDVDNYLERGTNKKIFYKIYKSANEINSDAIIKLLKEAIVYDRVMD